jgi:hypothetical protein
MIISATNHNEDIINNLTWKRGIKIYSIVLHVATAWGVQGDVTPHNIYSFR